KPQRARLRRRRNRRDQACVPRRVLGWRQPGRRPRAAGGNGRRQRGRARVPGLHRGRRATAGAMNTGTGDRGAGTGKAPAPAPPPPQATAATQVPLAPLPAPAPRSPVPGPRFALCAGEASGDLLGASLVDALRVRFPDAEFAGIGGDAMRAAGFEAWHDAQELAVMGFAEVLSHLPRLLRLRAAFRKRVLAWRPDAFIGIDAPDFNLGVEKWLKRRGVRTVHYVSPSVWAWRQKRAEKIGLSADRVLCLFPMEPPIYARHGVDARFVGHPLADAMPLEPDRNAARAQLDLPADAPVLAVLPGSRLGEISRLGAPFLEAAAKVAGEVPGLQVVIPAANAACRQALEALLSQSQVPNPQSRLIDGQARTAMVAA